MTNNQNKQVDNLKIDWKKLWIERMDDKLGAGGIAINVYSPLFLEKGTIIHATCDFKPFSFKEILEKHEIENAERYIPANPTVGGWSKFIKK